MRKQEMNKLLDQLEDEVKFDSYYLNRDQSDSIYCRIAMLREHINSIYDKPKPKVFESNEQ